MGFEVYDCRRDIRNYSSATAATANAILPPRAMYRLARRLAAGI